MKINVPAKVLSASILTVTGTEDWPYDDGEGDPFWSGGSTPRFYRWIITGTVTAQTHGSHLTRQPGVYNGLDIYVGDFIAGATNGKALKVISVNSKTSTTFEIEVEDVFRYNTFRSNTGDGSISGSAIIFSINEEGNPVLDPIPIGLVNSQFFPNVTSRFNAFRLQDNYLLSKNNNGFSAGDPIAIDPIGGDYEIADSNSYDRLIGTVASAGPGPHNFLLSPTTRIIENFSPALPGNKGDFIYADPLNPGEYSTTANGREIFLQLTDAIPSNAVGTVIGATVTIGNVLVINGIDVTFTGTTLNDVIDDINDSTSTHNIVASLSSTLTTAETVSGNLKIGAVALFNDSPGPASATINGVLVTFNDSTDGLAEFGQNAAIDTDMARSINAANIPNIVAVGQGSAAKLTITNTAGGPITIVNVDNDRDGTPFAGPTSGSGLPLSTAASTDTVIQLTGPKGEGILLQNGTGDPLGDLGLVSVQNGKLPVGLVIEQGIRKGDMFVVSDITSRDALSVLIGDQVMVLDKGDGDWGLYLYDGSSWMIISTEESARTDSRTLSVLVDFSSPSTVNIGEVSGGVRISPVTIEVITPFDSTPTISVGDVGDTSRLFSDNNVDLSSVGIYASTPSYQYPVGSDEDIFVTFASNGATTGSARITITYS